MAEKQSADELPSAFSQMSVDVDDINVLLLGETGIGKSTFINAFTNYLHYKSFELAEKNDVKCLVPAKFEITDVEDGHFKRKFISIGKDDNENTSITSAATQTARSYVFPLPFYNSRKFRLIDTPGICDDRGIDKDKENLENILSYIGQIEHLHAICILLKPNNARLTVAFHYCVTQLLSRLEKSAGDNIIFVFTNSRSTFYKPGDTSTALIEILDLIAKKPPHVKIKFDKENVFCLDNEAFRYLAAIKQNVNLANKSSYVDSWQQSVQECERLIKFVVGDGPTKINPHLVSKTISVNKARQVINELSKPLADITEHINDNIYGLEKHKKGLEDDNLSIETLRSQLFVPIVNLEQIPCSRPKTVCASSKCSEIVAVGNVKKTHYKQRCHEPCSLRSIPNQIIGDKGLARCAAMNTDGLCNHCGCHFSVHMHIYYETRTVEDKIERVGIKEQIVDREIAIKETKKIMQDIEQIKNEYETEKQVIIKTMAKFAHFLGLNAISPFNDAYKVYIEYLIKRESALGPQCNEQTLHSLESLLMQYNEEKKILQDAMKMPGTASDNSANTTSDILKQIQALYALPRTGPAIKNLHNLQKQGEAYEHRNTEFVLPNFAPYESDTKENEVTSNCVRNDSNSKVTIVATKLQKYQYKTTGSRNKHGKKKLHNEINKNHYQNKHQKLPLNIQEHRENNLYQHKSMYDKKKMSKHSVKNSEMDNKIDNRNFKIMNKSERNMSEVSFTDSDNEISVSFRRFLKEKGLDKRQNNYEELYGDGQSSEKNSTFVSTLYNIISFKK